MTDTPMPLPDDDAVGRWLAAQRASHVNALTDFLDVEAGLREALVHAHHDAMVQDLGQALDIEGGLAAILPGARPAPAHEEPAPAGDPSAFDEDLHSRIAALSPRERLLLRTHPAISAGVTATAVVRVLDLTVCLGQTLDVDHAPVRELDLVRDLVRDLTRFRDLAHVLAHGVAHGPDGGLDVGSPHPSTRALVHGRGLALDLTRDLDSCLVVALGLDLRLRDAPDGGRESAVERDVTYGFFRDLGLSLDRTLSLSRELARCLAHDIVRDLARSPDHPHEPDLDRARVLAHNLRRSLAPYRNSNRPNRAHRLDRDRLARDQARHLVFTVGLAANELLGLDITAEVAPETVVDLLGDLTHTDLSAVDLTDIELEGVRWSEHATRWPASIDVERLREESLEDPAGSGAYVVRGGTTATDVAWV